MSEWVAATRVILSLVARGFDLDAAGNAIADAAANGTIRARNASNEEKIWAALWSPADSLEFARSGMLPVPRDYSTSVRVLGGQDDSSTLRIEVEFHAKQLPEFFDSSAAKRNSEKFPASERLATLKPGGRPTAEWWDDLWLALFKRLYSDGWRPKTQAAIVDAMEEWLNARGKSAAESTLKSRARKLFMALELGEDC